MGIAAAKESGVFLDFCIKSRAENSTEEFSDNMVHRFSPRGGDAPQVSPLAPVWSFKLLPTWHKNLSGPL